MKKSNLSKKIRILSSNSNAKSQFLKDPIHNEILFENNNKWMFKLLETNEFKRLEKIKQLGLSPRFFPGATHTRASHCLGVYEVMRRILNNTSFSQVSQKCRKTLLTGALLHDIGHAPHSHAFEEYFYTDFTLDSKKIFVHEDMSSELITNPLGEIYPILIKSGVNPQDVADLITANESNKNLNPWMIQLLSSQLDVDRIDYLLRDTYYSGTSYGQIDANVLLHWAYFIPKQNCVAFSRKAIPTIENFLVGRFHMYQTVYFNDKTVLASAVLWFAFRRIKELVKENNFQWGPFDYIGRVLKVLFNNKQIGGANIDDYLRMDDHSFETFLAHLYEHSNDKILSKIFESFFVENKYKIIFFNNKEQRDLVWDEMNLQSKELQYQAVLYDWQHTSFYRGSKNKSIMVCDELGEKAVPIEHESALIANGNKIFETQALFQFGILIHSDLEKQLPVLKQLLARAKR
ncbi:HD domain-containing protein [[Mycoplasma] testudinis]|uniref:HD domain-containing protein n=1 Tax=[Mycoplasma] testudinis TaxID=33924 RepID=UPI000696F28C|nr:HD domain-containing protein [[Mycoplasma] testudinis]